MASDTYHHHYIAYFSTASDTFLLEFILNNRPFDGAFTYANKHNNVVERAYQININPLEAWKEDDKLVELCGSFQKLRGGQ